MRLFLVEGMYARREERGEFINDVRNAVLSVLNDEFPVQGVIDNLKNRAPRP